MYSPAAILGSSDTNIFVAKQDIVEDCFRSFDALILVANEELDFDSSLRLVSTIYEAEEIVCILIDSLNYQRSPVLSAYLKYALDYVTTQLAATRKERDRQALALARQVMGQLYEGFAAAHRRAHR
jgi:flagellin-specific chaperone FliS